MLRKVSEFISKKTAERQRHKESVRRGKEIKEKYRNLVNQKEEEVSRLVDDLMAQYRLECAEREKKMVQKRAERRRAKCPGLSEEVYYTDDEQEWSRAMAKHLMRERGLL